MFPTGPIPSTAPKRFVQVTGLTGIDAFMSFVLPRALFMRVIAIKILRAAGDLPKDASVIRQLLTWRNAKQLPLQREHAIGFQYEGRPVWIRDGAGLVWDAAKASELSDYAAKSDELAVAKMD